MASVVWDAANVLQVYHHRRCIGTTTRNTRCSLTIKEPHLSAIAPLLDRMSRNSPELVTEQTLFQLAGLCLCGTYHGSQAYEFVRLWTSVVKEVVSVEQRKFTLQNEIATLFQQTLKLEWFVSNLQADLNAEKWANAKAQKDFVAEKWANAKAQEQFKRDAKGLQEEIMNLKQDLQASEDRNNVGEAKLSATRRNLEKLQVQAFSDLLARNGLETENKSLKAEIVDAQKKLDDYLSIKEQNHDLGNQAKSLEHKIKEYLAVVEDTANKAHASEEKVAAERAAKEAMENRYKAQIAEQEAEITGLKSHREKLEHSVARLQASVKTCWWHRFRAWKDRFRKRDRSGSWVSITDESAEDITLRTYR